MINRTIKYIADLIRKLIEITSNILIPKEEQTKKLESLGPDGLFENIPRAENFDLPTRIDKSRANVKTEAIKAIFNYRTPLCRQAIWEIKYHANKKLISDFSVLMYEFILDELVDLQIFHNFNNVILVPIPSTKIRLREKGFNQCSLICRELLRIDKERNGNNFNLLENFVIKNIDTAHQARVSNRKKRLTNLKGVFSIDMTVGLGFSKAQPPIQGSTLNSKKGSTLASHSFIIIDDVITTGATMNEAFRALKSAGIPARHIRGFALAH